MKNSEAILVTPKQFEIQECAVPEPKDHEILMKVEPNNFFLVLCCSK